MEKKEKLFTKSKKTHLQKLILSLKAIILISLLAITSCNDTDIAVKEILLNEEEATITVGDAPLALIYTISPSSATNTTVSWRSSDETVASVNKDGIVTAIAKGKAAITVITQDGDKRAHCNITVIDGTKNEACNIISFKDGSINWVINGNQITYNYEKGSDVSAITPIITISPKSKISPSSGDVQNFTNGNIVKYTVTAENGTTREYFASAIVLGQTPILSKESEIISFKDGSKEWNFDGFLIQTEYPFGTDISAIAPTITISAKATISPASDVPQNFNNWVYYVVTAEDGITTKNYQAKATIASKVSVESVTFNGKPNYSVEIPINTKLHLKANVQPSNASIKTVTWASNEESIATVDANGIVMTKAEGIAIITVTTDDGGFTATCTIKVKPEETEEPEEPEITKSKQR